MECTIINLRSWDSSNLIEGLLGFLVQQQKALNAPGKRSNDMDNLIAWFKTAENAVAVLVTVGVAVFLICCLECTNCPSRDKDDLFRRRQV